MIGSAGPLSQEFICMLNDALTWREEKKQISALFFQFSTIFALQLTSVLISSLLLLQNCFSDHKKASNLEAYVDWFNRLSYLVATEICMVSNELFSNAKPHCQ